MANRLPRSTPSPGKRGSGGLAIEVTIEDVELRPAEHDAGHLLHRHVDDAVDAAVGRVAHQSPS